MSPPLPIRQRAVRGWNDRRQRRIAYAVLAALLAVLCAFPQPYVARAKIVPQDSSNIGLNSTMTALGGQFQGFAALLGGARQPIDLYLAIGRSTEVADDVIRRLKLVGPDGYASTAKARLALDRQVDVHSLTGGILEVEVRNHDPVRARALTAAFAQSISHRIVALDEDRIKRKQDVVMNRFKEASARVVAAEAALDDFRRRNRLAEPATELGSALSLRTGLEAQLQAKQVELQMLERVQGPENPQLQAVQSAIASLRAQIARTATAQTGAAGPTVAGLSGLSNEYLTLYRDYRFAQALYEVYARSSEEVAVEAIAGETATDVQAIEAAHVDADRKFNIPAVALLALVALIALFTEIYAPATGMNLRIGRTRHRRRNDA